MTNTSQALIQLSQLYGINTSYWDMNGVSREASEESLMAVLRALGTTVVKSTDIPAAQRLKHLQNWQSPIEPVIVIWENSSLMINLKLPAYLLGKSVPLVLTLESGQRQEILWKIDPSAVLEQKNIEGSVYLLTGFTLRERLPFGYHKLTIEMPGQNFEALIISAPLKAFGLNSGQRIWGLFMPLYALHSSTSWGAGDFSDLKKLMEWTTRLGGNLVGTLPLLAGFFDPQYGPGPYLPASKLFWNEFYLNIASIPEYIADPTTRAAFESESFHPELIAAQKSGVVQYDCILRLKRQIIEKIAAGFVEQKPARFRDFQSYCTLHPELLDYARFRAAGEKYGLNWHDWPDRQRDGELHTGDFEEENLTYHAYSQWLAAEQIEGIHQQASHTKTLLYMDLPVGVHPFSYDIWRERGSFVGGIDCGAPPDPAFTNGQNWGFPPLHPETIRTTGYRYFIQSLRHQMQSCGMLRIDHMMNFHRLFWIPQGMSGSGGVYVNYRAEEFYAILVLESLRYQSIIVGEDLGLVPPEVRPMMEKHNIRRMFIGQYELVSENQVALIPSNSVAGLNTHDMYPFAAFWEETDIDHRQKTKMIDDVTARAELDQRRRMKQALISILKYQGLTNEMDQDTAATLRATLKLLAASPAEVVIINLEDLWLEQQTQNIPGTFRPQNWSRKSKNSFEQFIKLPYIVQLLQEIDKARKGDVKTN